VIPSQRIYALSGLAKEEIHTADPSIIDEQEQEVVNVYYINENNLYGRLHVQLDIGDVKLTAVLDTGAENFDAGRNI
jgi:hypothetical protein